MDSKGILSLKFLLLSCCFCHSAYAAFPFSELQYVSIAHNTNFTIYENDNKICRSLNAQVTDVIKDDFFDIKGYFISQL